MFHPQQAVAPRCSDLELSHLTPGGYIELFDSVTPIACDDGTLPPDSPLLKWSNLLLEASRKMGRPIDSVLQYKQQLADAGFVNIVQVEYKWPINPWPRDKKHKTLGTLMSWSQAGH